MASGIPEGHHSVQPYLIFKSSVAALAFYVKAFGAVEELCMKGPDGRVAHASIRLGDSVVMMADENPAMQAYSPEHFGGSPVSLMVYTEDCDAMFASALAAGAVGEREPTDEPYGDRMCGILDPFGYRWYLATHTFDVSRADLEKL